MRQLSQPAELTADREPTHEPVNEEAKHRSSSFFQHNDEGDARGQDRLLAKRPSADPGTRCRHYSFADRRIDIFSCNVCRQHQYLGRPRYEQRPSDSNADSRDLSSLECYFIAAGALPDTYWARELDVDLDEWNTYLRCGFSAFLDVI